MSPKVFSSLGHLRGRLLLCLLSLGAVSPVAQAFVLEGPRWPSNAAVVMHLELGATNRKLTDGFASWDASAADALRLWNQYLIDGVQFQAVVGSTAAIGDSNGINTVSYASDVFGQAFGSDVLAVTVLSSTDDNATFLEADVLFNAARKWDSYVGLLHQDPGTGQPLIDFHRVALHEFGHVLGLDHADPSGQPALAIMNSQISSTISGIETDDINGVRSVYRPFGRLVKTFSLNAGRLLADPVRPRLYATLPSDNALAVINTDTLEVLANFYVGANPVDLAISPAGDRLYVANSDVAAGSVAVVDLFTLTPLAPVPVPLRLGAIAASAGNQVYVLGSNGYYGLGSIFRIDVTTGAVQDSFGYPAIYNATGFLQISPDHGSLYFGDTGISSSTLARYDVSTAKGVLVQTSHPGSNGQSLTISHGGQFFCFPNGSGNAGSYGTTLIPAGDVTAALGTFQTGPYPRQVAFSPDDALLYEAGNSERGIQVFDTRTFNPVGSFIPSNQTGATVDYSNRVTSMAVTSGAAGYLFLATGGDSFGPSGPLRAYSAASNPERPPREVSAASVVGAGATRGGFVVSCSNGPLDVDLTVRYHNGGGAIQGQDYVPFPGTITIPAGQGEAVIPVTLLPGANRNHKVKVFLDPGAGYDIGKAQSKVLLSELP